MLDGFNVGRAGGILFLALLWLVPVSGEAAQVKAEIPFSFSVNRATLPPGSYLVSPNVPTPGTLVIRGTTRVVIAMTIQGSASENLKPRLVFHRYGDEYFLRQVWNADGTGHELGESGEERDRREGRRGNAGVHPERIVVPVL